MSDPSDPSAGVAWGDSVNPPVERASTRLMARAEDLYRGEGSATYGRHGHRVHEVLRGAFTDLEGGAGCSLAPSGVAAVSAALMAVCEAGTHILVSDSVYGPTRRTAFATLKRFGVEAQAYDPRIGAGIAERIRDNTAAIMLESPGSLTFEVQDVPAIVAAAQARGVATVLDNTWSGGVFFKPLAHGVDISVHAATKYPSGSSDVFLGAVVSRTAPMADAVAGIVKELGLAVSPDDAYLVLRGMRTLALRMVRHDATARRVAQWLQQRPEVAHMLHPALAGHPDHAVWARDFVGVDGDGAPSAAPGAGGLFAFALHPQTRESQVLAFLNALEVFGLGFSYGGFESLAIHCDPQLRRAVSAPQPAGPLVRLAIGLDPAAALIADLERGFAAMAQAS